MLPFWQNTVAILLAICSGVYLLIDRLCCRSPFQISRSDIFFLLWLSLVVFCGFGNPSLLTPILYLFFVAWSVSKCSNVRWLWLAWGAGYIICLCSAIAQLVRFDGVRLFGWVGNPGIFANILLPFFCLLLSGVFFAKRVRYKRLSVLLVLPVLVCLVLTQSRAAWAGALAALLFLMLMHPPILGFLAKRSILQKVGLAALTLASIILVTFYMYRMRPEPVNGRKLIYTVSTNAVVDSPQGRGLGSFSVDYTQLQGEYLEQHTDSRLAIFADDSKFAFNDILQVGFEMGWLGMLLFLLSLLFLLRISLQQKCRMEMLGLKASLLGFFVASFFSYPLYQWIPGIQIALLTGMLLSYDKRTIKSIRISSLGYLVSLLLIAVVVVFAIQKQSREYSAYQRWDELRKQESTERNEETVRSGYHQLLAEMPYNGLLKYHYGITLFELGEHEESIAMLEQASNRYSELNLWMCMAENYRAMGKYSIAAQYFWKVYYMVPKRFMPLYKLMLVYKESGDMEAAKRVALQILSKEVKIPSPTVEAIKQEALVFLQRTADSTR